MSQTVFIADLHLSEQTPSLNALFERCLRQWQGRIDALYVLGDFFDAWVGDDDDSAFIRHIKALLREFTRDTPLYLQHGNRDFLLGEAFAVTTGVCLLPEQVQIDLYGQTCVLVHGDELCTDDLAYQQFRLQSRNPQWQQAVLGKPLAERRLLAAQIRQMSETRKDAEGKSEISDATAAGIDALMRPFHASPMPVLIHGHTHRPATHRHEAAGGQPFTRHVLQDWYGNCGGYLLVDRTHGISTHRLDADSFKTD